MIIGCRTHAKHQDLFTEDEDEKKTAYSERRRWLGEFLNVKTEDERPDLVKQTGLKVSISDNVKKSKR